MVHWSWLSGQKDAAERYMKKGGGEKQWGKEKGRAPPRVANLPRNAPRETLPKPVPKREREGKGRREREEERE